MSAPCFSSRLRQHGMVTVMAVMFLITVVIFVLSQTLGITGSNSMDTTLQMDSEAALFLAESGVEQAQATINTASQGGSYTDATCTNLASISPKSLGNGTFRYTAATSSPISCGGVNPACTGCTVSVAGTVRSSTRTISAGLTTTTTQGVEGNGTTFTLNMTSTVDGAAAFTNLAFRAKAVSGGGSNADVSSCTNTAGTCSLTDGWYLQQTGTNSVSSMGLYASVPTAGVYTITDVLTLPRNYVQTGALFYPLSGSVGHVGAYGAKTGSNKTVGTSSTSSTLPNNWNCATNSGTAGVSVAAGADTLVYGFSSWPASAANQLNGITLGIQPLRQILNMTGTQGDNLYSQIWYSYNPAYYSTGPTGATNGANFTGTIGATFTGTITGGTNPRTLTLTSAANLAPGSRITNSTGTTVYGTLPATAASGTWGANGSTYTMNSTAEVSPATSLRAYDVLTLSTAPTSGVLTLSDKITNSTGAIIHGTLGALSSGTWGAAGSTYALPSTAYFTASASLQSAGTTITLPGATATPSAGTAIAISSGTGVFDSANVTGSINGTTLTVTSCSSGTPSNGDALFGINVLANTRITGPLSSGTACAGTYPVNNSQTAASGSIVARAAVVSAVSANSYTVSRQPTTRLSSGAQLCGGVCAFFFGNAGSNTTFNLSNITSGDDWASGFACLSGVDPTQIKILGTIVSKLSTWTEVVK